MLRQLGIALCTVILGAGAQAAHGACVDLEPHGYRMQDYRAPPPCTLAGGRVVTVEEVRDLVAAQAAVLIDVLPAPRRPRNLSESTLWQPKRRWNIPGSVWLANSGLGVLPVEEETYFRDNLARVTSADPSRTVVFYCLANCWMSWNAAKRAIAWGYTSVAWFPDGTDAWILEGLPLEDNEPIPLPE